MVETRESAIGNGPTFLLVMGNTQTGKIPGISAAGENPELTDYTPPADGELLLYGECRCIDGVPITPEGIPTPAVISRAALDLLEPNSLLVNAGLSVEPEAPYVDLGGEAGGDVRTETPVPLARRIYERGKILGASLSRTGAPLVVGESIAGGTTTAKGVLAAMGYDSRVSSSLPENPRGLKEEVVHEGLEASGLEAGSLSEEPLEAVERMGDPVIAAAAGIASGASSDVLLAGGTQMAAVAAVAERPLEIGTTRWIEEDPSSALHYAAEELDVDVKSSGLSFADSEHQGLGLYEEGAVKEGVGAGALAYLAEEEFGTERLLREVERVYESLV